ncbi:TMEM175 family protein [Xanthomonas sacchari]|uniref:TMEM175 family protein n=2 Tax=Xanthomonas sacchari TaxID=56458 RepID=UPI0022580F28|nr:TMEM175 family protein [Xanthomonas sacchari]MCW0464202.1 hypothetical protein [Xanthomonas sacchari]
MPVTTSHADSADSKYPHDRVVFFSDAVFAIAITLLAVEIKVPGHAEVAAAGGILAALHRMLPLFIGFAVSFLVTALFWKSHLQLCRHIRQFDDRLIWLNVLQLLLIGLLPFSTALYSDYFGSHEAFSVYCAHLAAIGLAGYWLHAYAVRKEGLAQRLGALQAQAMKLRAAVSPVVFALCIPVGMVAPWLGRFGFLAVFLLQWGVMRVYQRRIRQAQAAPAP